MSRKSTIFVIRFLRHVMLSYLVPTLLLLLWAELQSAVIKLRIITINNNKRKIRKFEVSCYLFLSCPQLGFFVILFFYLYSIRLWIIKYPPAGIVVSVHCSYVRMSKYKHITQICIQSKKLNFKKIVQCPTKGFIYTKNKTLIKQYYPNAWWYINPSGITCYIIYH